MTKSMQEYYLGRERAERAAANCATGLARRIHVELADRYASLARERVVLSAGSNQPSMNQRSVVSPGIPRLT